MRYIALDIGDVLCHIDHGTIVNKLSYILNISIADSERFFKSFWEQHDLGNTNLENELISKLKVNSPAILNRLSDLWNKVAIPNDMFIDFINDLRIKYDVKVALVSNIGIEHAELMKTLLSRGNLYNESIKHFSCHVGARKPSYLYYQSFLSMHPEFKGCMYLDDLEKNRETGSLFGFHSYNFSLKNYYPFQTSMSSLEEEVKNIETVFININKIFET